MGPRDRTRALLTELREAHRSLPQVLEDPARIKRWLRSARRAYFALALLLGIGMFAMPPARDAIASGVFPDRVSKGFFGLGKRVHRNPMQAPVRAALSVLYWLGTAGVAGTLLWLQLPRAAAGVVSTPARAAAASAQDDNQRGDDEHVATAPTALGLPNVAPLAASSVAGQTSQSAVDATLVGQVSAAPARYAIAAELGRGGMGVVYRARDTLLGRDVALKQLFPELAQNRELAARFQREAQVLARLTHPSVVQVFDLVLDASGMWMAMEMLTGGSLELHIEVQGPLRLGEIKRLGLQMADALAHAHDAGVVHRDFKPANVMLTASGDVKVTDFGLAALADHDRTAKLTRPGSMMGSPAYMSPEQITGGEVKTPTDVYALGATFYEMAAGRPPFDGPVTSVLTQQLTAEPELPPPSAASLPNAFVELLAAMLSKRAAERPAMIDVRGALAKL